MSDERPFDEELRGEDAHSGGGAGGPSEDDLRESSPGDAPGEDPEPEDEEGSGRPADAVAAVERERDELLDTLRRVQADFENFRKRVMRDQTAQVERAAERLVEELLPVLDSFELAVLNVPSGELDETSEKLRKGVELVYAELFAVLEKAGLERVDALGKPFDPNEHEAVLRDDGDGEPVVTEVMRAGYRFKGRVMRPAMVRVGAAG